MGAGRTELLMHLVRRVGRRRAAASSLDGAPLAAATPRSALDAGLVLVSEDRKRYGLILEQSIGFNLSLSARRPLRYARGLLDEHARGARRTAPSSIRSASRRATSTSARRALSGGNQQKVVLGKALLTGPKVVLLDEPTRGIDVGAKIEVYELVNRLTDEGKAVVLVSSELPELMGMSDRISCSTRAW